MFREKGFSSTLLNKKVKEIITVSAKPIKVGNLSNILVGTELNLRQILYLYISGDREDFIGEYVDSE